MILLSSVLFIVIFSDCEIKHNNLPFIDILFKPNKVKFIIRKGTLFFFQNKYKSKRLMQKKMLKSSFMNFPSLDNIKVKLKDLLIESFIANIAFILNHLIKYAYRTLIIFIEMKAEDFITKKLNKSSIWLTN